MERRSRPRSSLARVGIVDAMVVLRTVRHPFSLGDDRQRGRMIRAGPNRFGAIRAIPIAIGSSKMRFREVVQKNFWCPLVDESDAIPSS